MLYSRFADFERVSLTLAQIAAWRKESEYSATYPTGVIPGKRWLRNDGHFDPTCNDPGWLLCEYSEAFIGADGHERCKVLMKRAVIRVPAMTDRMYVVRRRDIERAIASIPVEDRKEGERGVRYTKTVIEFCEQTFGYMPERSVEACILPLEEGNGSKARFIFKFRDAKDALVFKMWFE